MTLPSNFQDISITVNGANVLDAPTGMSTNVMVNHCGTARYGVAKFCMNYADAQAAMIVNPVKIVVKQNGVSTTTYWIPVYMKPIYYTGTPTGNNGFIPFSQNYSGTVELTLFDLRYDGAASISKAYNVQDSTFANYYKSTLNSGSPWTWQQILTDLSSDLSLPVVIDSDNVSSNLPTWVPRNLVFDGIWLSKIVDELASRMLLIVGFDQSITGSQTAFLVTLYNASNAPTFGQTNTTVYESTQKASAFIGGGSGAYLTSNSLQPASVNFIFRGIGNASDPFSSRAYTKNVTNPGSNGSTPSGPAIPWNVGDFIAISSTNNLTAPDNQSDLDAVANYLAPILFTKFAINKSYAMFAGYWPFVTDGVIRGIKWSFGKEVTTTILINDDSAFTQPDEMRRGLDGVQNVKTIGLGGTEVASTSGDTKYIWSPTQQIIPPSLSVDISDRPKPQDRNVIVKIMQNEIGGGKYGGDLFMGNSAAAANTNLAMPETMLDTGNVNALIINLAEGGLGDVHLLPLHHFYHGIILGYTTEAAVRTIVAINSWSSNVFAVTVTQVGGADGTSSTPASWAYTVRTVDASVTLGINISLARRRPNGSMSPGNGFGLAFFDANGNLDLWDAGEIPI